MSSMKMHINQGQYIKQWAPKELNINDVTKTFKDLVIESVIERLSDVKLFYIETMLGRGDELYYFSNGDCLFHGEMIWSRYHPFLSKLENITPSAEVTETSWFVGSRNNYTHQLLDFLPNLIYKGMKGGNQSWSNSINVLGSVNNILNTVSEVPSIKSELNKPKVLLKN